MSIFLEQVPDDMSDEHRAYFTRMFTQIVNDSELKGTIPPITSPPVKPVAGKLYYFENPSLPNILWPGWWGWNGTEWVNVDSNNSVLAIYGGIRQSLEPALSDIGATWQTIPFDTAALTNPVGITQDFANDKLIFPYKGIYRLALNVALSHNELNAGREVQITFYSPSNAARSTPVSFGTGRNVGTTNISASLLFEVPSSSTGNDIQLQINSVADTYLTVVLQSARFDANLVSESQI